MSEHLKKIQEVIKERKRLEKFVEKHAYRPELTLSKNLQLLADSLVESFEIEGPLGHSLRAYLIESNLPIEVTLQPLKIGHLVSLLTEWLSHFSQGSFTNERLYTVIHRNSLFRTVFHEQKETIDEYFLTLNPLNMLIADDIFSLLQDILSPYFLYEYQNDKETFFEKERALETFKEIVHSFAVDDHRILFSPQSEKYQYIRRLEFEKLIEFWESSNNQLTLLPAPRKMIKNIGVQTPLAARHNFQMQTTPPSFTFIDLLNSTIAKLAAASEEGEDQEAVERIASFLRGEKIALLRMRQGEPEVVHEEQSLDFDFAKTKKFRMTTPKDGLEMQLSPKTLPQAFTPRISLTKSGLKSQQIIENRPKTSKFANQTEHYLIGQPFPSIKAILSEIYQHYRQGENFTYRKLELCLFEMKVIALGQQRLISQLIRKGLIKNTLNISSLQFSKSLEWIMENQEISKTTLLNFHKSLQKKLEQSVAYEPACLSSRRKPYSSHYRF